MKKILLKLPKPVRLIIVLTELIVFGYCLWHWTFGTCFVLFLLAKLKEHWKEVISVVIIGALTSIGGIVFAYLFQWISGCSDSARDISIMFFGIYALGLIIEPDNHKPYIWLWKQCKRLFKQKNHYVHTV